MYRYFVVFICFFLVSLRCFSQHQLPAKTDHILPTNLGEANWQPLFQVELPSGKPRLKKNELLNLDLSFAFTPTAHQRIESPEIVSSEWVSFKSQFKPFTSPVKSSWKSVKPAQYALNVQSDIRHFSIRQGLPTGAVYSVQQDVDDMIWLGTNGEGACQYTGNYLRCLTDQDGLNNNRVWDIAKHVNGELWLATDRGVNVFDGNVVSALQIDGALYTPKVNDILFDDDTTYLASDEGLYLAKHGSLSRLKIGNSLKINQLLKGPEQSIWLATDIGLFQYRESKLYKVELPEPSCQGPILAMASAQNTVWLGVKGTGVCQVDWSSKQIVFLSGLLMPNIQTLAYDQNAVALWIGDDSKGVIRITGNSAHTLNSANGLNDHHIRDIMLGSQGNVWIATYGGGVNRLKEHSFQLLTKRNGLLNERVSALANINERLWIGQYGTGFQILDNSQWFNSIYDFSDQYVHAISISENESVWVGTRAGLIVIGNNGYQRMDRQMGLDADIVHRIIASQDGCMYLAAQSGVIRACEGAFEKLVLPDMAYVVSIFEDTSKRLWFVTNGQGIYYLERGTLFHITEAQGLPSNWAYSIAQVLDDFVALGTRRGVLLLKKDINGWRSRHVSVSDGLSNNIILSLLVQGDVLWAGTERGINRFKPQAMFGSNSSSKPQQYTYDNGYIAVDSTLNTALLFKGSYYWGAGKGVSYFKPESVKINVNSQVNLLRVSASQSGSPRPKFKDIEHLTHPLIDLPATTFQIRFQYSHSEWGNPERIMYQTRLIGSNEYWSDPSYDDEMTFTQLSPGNYEFQVRISTQDKTADYEYFSFVIQPPWWQTWWAFSLGLLFVIGAIYSLLKLRFEFIQKQQRISDRAEFSEALLARKKQLLAEVSHEIRTPLSVLKMQIEALEYNLVENTEQTYELLHRRIGDISTLIADIDQLAMTELSELSLNIKVIDVVPWLTSWADDARTRSSQLRECEFSHVVKLPKNLFINADQDRLTQVLNNLLSNSLRYTTPPIRITFEATYTETQLVLSLSDSAPSVSEHELSCIFTRLYQNESNKTLFKGGTGLGLTICKDLIERHSGEIEAQHSELGGLTVRVTLPR
ncbi:ATP-binding protein [Pseudoalteromonas aurantia]|uniref:histidine kinase n=1 Tax=Pseudoalteromonas aurantia 208 TaxID=1314867 RepID=A0ABR9EIX5_9GAMM|nr:ATP-binding protein [Pseudoalteromonas aurantia]MBE0370190.1 hypothetical protein [Pseudoalteromonas aurantia 208]